MKKILAGLLVCSTLVLQTGSAQVSFTAFAGGAFLHPTAVFATVPNLSGLSLAAADAALMAVNLDTGTTSPQCSLLAVNTVTSQDIPAMAMVPEGTLINLLFSTGVACPGAQGRRNNGTSQNGVGFGL